MVSLKLELFVFDSWSIVNHSIFTCASFYLVWFDFVWVVWGHPYKRKHSICLCTCEIENAKQFKEFITKKN